MGFWKSRGRPSVGKVRHCSRPPGGRTRRSGICPAEIIPSRGRYAAGTARHRGRPSGGGIRPGDICPAEFNSSRSRPAAGTARHCSRPPGGRTRRSGICPAEFNPSRSRYAAGTVRRGSFTVEAALVVPIFLLALLVFLGFFPLLLIQTQVNAALQYTARIMAVSYQDEEEEVSIVSLAEGILLFRSYLGEHGLSEDFLENGVNSISLSNTDLSGEYVQLVANYEVELPTGFWGIDSLPVEQCVSAKKWTGAGSDSSDGEEDTEYVYITPSGSVYHTTTSCPYLSLSTRSVSYSSLSSLRNSNGNIYSACSCYGGESIVYVTNYGTLYHGSLSCSYLKRTIYKVKLDAVGDRSACSKCGGG